MLIGNVVVFYVSGIAFFFFYKDISFSWLFLTILLLLFSNKKYRKFALLFVFLGFFRMSMLDYFQVNIEYNEKTLVCVQGVVQQAVFPSHLTSKEYARFVIKVKRIKVNTKWKFISQRIYIMLKKKMTNTLHRGNVVEIIGIIEKIPQAKNPGEFDRALYWKIKDVHQQIIVRLAEHIKILNYNAGCPFLNFFGTLNYNYSTYLLKLLGKDVGGIAIALTLGNKSFLSKKTRELFIHGGVLHLFAISGFHIAIIAGILFKICNFVSSKYFLNLIFVIIFLIFYAILTGGNASVVRAVVVISMYLLAPILGREKNTFSCLGWAAFVLLLFNPYYVQDVGFQLSFLICFCIVWLIQKHDSKATVLQSIRVTIVACICSFPLTAYHFFSISPAAALSSIILVPFVYICMIGSFSLLFFPFVIFHKIFATCTYFFYNVLLFTIQCVVCIPYHYICVPPPSFEVVCIFYVCVWKIRFTCIWTLSFLCIFVIISGYGKDIFLPENMMVVLDVGHGDCICIRYDGKYYLYDCGSMRVIPFLRKQGIQTLEAIIISHADIDHYRAIVDVIKMVKVNKVICNIRFMNNPIVKIIQSHKIPIQVVIDQQQVDCFRFLYPGSEFAKKHDDNEHSLGAIVSINGYRCLLLGDMENKALKLLLKKNIPKIHTIQIPHHGSHNKYTNLLLQTCKPKFATLSSKKNFPNQEILEIYKQRKVEVLATYQKGAIFLYFP